MSQRPHDAFAVVGLGLRLAIRHWWRLLSAMLPVLVVARLAHAWFETGTGAAIVNGRVLPGEPLPTAFRFDLSGPEAEIHLAVPLALALGWLLAVLLALPMVIGVATAGPPVTVRACWRRLGSRLPAIAALAVLLAGALLALASVAGLVGASLESPLVAAATAAAGAPLMAPLALAVPAVFAEGLSLTAALRRGVEVTRSGLWSIASALLLGMGIMPGAVWWIAGTIERADVSAGGPVTNAILAGLCTALASVVTMAVAPLAPAVLALMFMWARDRPAAGDALEPPARQAHWPMTQPEPVKGAVMVALAVAALLPAATVTGQVLWNPGQLPVFAEEPYYSADEIIAATTASDGRPTFVSSTHVTRCADVRCSRTSYVAMPCIDGAEPRSVGDDARSCSIEGPLGAATLRPDGMLVGVRFLPPNALRLLHCRVTDADQCRWGGATTILEAPSERQFLRVAMADVPSGGIVVVVMRTEPDSDRGEVTLVRCADLGCSQPRLHRVGTVPAPAGKSGGPIAVAVEPSSGLVAVGYRDRLNGDLWLGGCSTLECDDAALTRIERSPAPPDPGLDGAFLGDFDDAGADGARGDLIVDATLAGPIALEHTNAGWVDVLTCADPRCMAYHASTIPASSARLMRTGSSGLVLVAAMPGGVALDRLDAPGAVPVRLPAASGTDVVAATAGSDGRPRLLLRDPTGSRLITCANPQCRG